MLPGVEGYVALRPCTGSLMGHAAASVEFSRVYRHPVQRWRGWVREEQGGWDLVARTPDLRSSELGVTGYADDITDKVCGENDAQVLASKIRASGEVLAREVAQEGFAMNEDKACNMLVAVGAGSQRVRRELLTGQVHVKGGVALVMRVLGGLLTANLSFTPEREVRIAAAKKGWWSLGGFWKSNASWGVKRAAWVSVVQGAMLSGVTAQLPGARDCEIMDQVLVGFLRKMMGKLATTPKYNASRTFSAISNLNVLAYWRIAPTKVELQIQRIRWYQDWAMYPDAHCQILCAVFGRMRAEHANTIDDTGVLSPTANPWAKRSISHTTLFAHGLAIGESKPVSSMVLARSTLILPTTAQII